MRRLLCVLAGVASAVVVASIIPAVVVAFYPENRFELGIYWEVFVVRHHDMRTWFERGWPEVILPISAWIGPFVGGMVAQTALVRSGGASLPSHPSIVPVAGQFAVCYAVPVIVASGVAGTSHPYPFSWQFFVGSLGVRQVGTLVVLAGVLSGVGAALVGLGQRSRG